MAIRRNLASISRSTRGSVRRIGRGDSIKSGFGRTDLYGHGWENRKWLAFAAWFFVSGFVYWFFELAKPISKFVCDAFFAIVTPATEEPHAAWAFASHAAGLGLFLLITTRQSRWLLATAVGWLSVLWGMGLVVPDKWHVLVAHAVGYAIQAGCLIAALGVFGGAVYLWTELLQFVKKIIRIYPQVRGNLHEHPLLEKVIVSSAISDRGSKDFEEDIEFTCTKNKVRGLQDPGEDDLSLLQQSSELLDSGESELELKPAVGSSLTEHVGSCFLCRGKGVATVAVCKEWNFSEDTKNLQQYEVLLSVCMPLAAMKAQRAKLQAELEAVQSELERERKLLAQVQTHLSESNQEIARLKAEASEKSPLHPILAQGTSPEQRAWSALLQREVVARQHAEEEAQRRGLETLEAFADAEEASGARAEMELKLRKVEETVQLKIDMLSSLLLKREKDLCFDCEGGLEGFQREGRITATATSSDSEIRHHKDHKGDNNKNHKGNSSSSQCGPMGSHTAGSHVSGGVHQSPLCTPESSHGFRLVMGSSSSGTNGFHDSLTVGTVFEGVGGILGETFGHGKKTAIAAPSVKAKKEIKRLLEEVLDKEIQLQACQDEVRFLQLKLSEKCST